MTAHLDIKAVFFDIDGTLTSFVTHVVPDSTIEALNALRDKGVKIFICTGRAPSHMGVVLDTMPVEFDGIVGLNGQYCFDSHGFLDAQPLDPTDVEAVTGWLDAHPDVVANYCESDFVYFNQITDAMRATWAKLGKTAPATHLGDPHERTRDHEVFQISPFVGLAQQSEIEALCRNVAGVRWHPDFVDLIPADGGKPRGMRAFMEHYGIAREETMAFGDGGNDTEMLRFAGVGVAMGNATDEPKAAADYITDDVDHDGVRNALIHFGVL